MKFSSFFLCLVGLMMPLGAGALEGAWRGSLQVRGVELSLVFNFEESEGVTSCTLDSPMQGVKGIPTQVSVCSADSVALIVPSIGGAFAGAVTATQIRGQFSQMGMSFPLTLTPDLPLSERRPQTPKAPFPYTAIDTTFTSPDGTVLAGTLTLPDAPAQGRPAVVLVTGSGPQNRDEELFDHRPFAVIADFLGRNGVATFRYDDRGVGESGGNFPAATIDSLRMDAGAALALLRSMPGFGKVGVLGHSEGGTIATMLAADGQADFAISLAGAFEPGKEIILAQNERVLKKIPGITAAQIADSRQLIARAFDDIIAGKSGAEIDIDAYAAGLDIPPMVLASVKRNVAANTTPHFRQLISLNPADWLGRIKVPLFAANGTLDTQVECESNLQVVKAQVPAASVKAYPGLNHMFQHATTGEMAEYANIRETISPELLADLLKAIP